MRRQAQNNIRSQVGGLNAQIARDVPYPKRVTFFDVFTFAAVFFSILFNSLSPRSIIFNIVIGVALLVKIFLGAFFYSKNNQRSLRIYFILRYTYNIIVIYPLIILMRFFTATYTLNYFLAGGILFVCELIITACHLRFLCIKRPVEAIEDIPGLKIMSIGNQSKKMVIHIMAKDAAGYVRAQIGENRAEQIIQNRHEQFVQIKKRSQKRNGSLTKSTNSMEDLYIDKEQEYIIDIKRTEDEIIAEKQKDEIELTKKNKSKQKYLAFQPSVNKIVVNEVQFFEYKYQSSSEGPKAVEYTDQEELLRIRNGNFHTIYQQLSPRKPNDKKRESQQKYQIQENEVVLQFKDLESSLSDVDDENNDVNEKNAAPDEDMNDENDETNVAHDELVKAPVRAMNQSQIKGVQGQRQFQSNIITNNIPKEVMQGSNNNNINTVPKQISSIPIQNKAQQQQAQVKKVVEKPKQEKAYDSGSDSSGSNYTDRGNIPVHKAGQSQKKTQQQNYNDSSSSLSDDDEE